MKKKNEKTPKQLRAEIDELKARLQEAEDTIQAIRDGAVDAVVVSGPRGEQIFTLSGEDVVYRQLVETMQEAGLTMTAEGKILFCNERFAVMVQQPMELIVGRPLDEFVAPFDHRSVVALLVGAQVRPTRKRVVFQASDGSHVPASVAANILEQAGPPKICMVATDLTELEASEQTLEETETQRQALEESTTALRESRLAALNLMEEAVAARQEAERLNEELRRAKDDWENTFNTVPDLIAVLDSEFRIVRLNRAMAERLGKTVGECVGTKCHETLHGLPEPPNYCPHILTLKDGKEHTAEFYEPRLGADFFVSTTPMFDEQGKMSGVIHVARDITELKAAEQALRESEQRYRRLVETATEGIWQLDGDFNTVYVNGQMAEMLGCKPEDVVGRNVREFMAEDQAEDVELRVANRQQGVSETYERKLRRKDGSTIWTLVSASPLWDSEGKIYGSFGMFTDITKRKKAEEALRASEARLRATLRSAVDEIWLVDTQGRIVSVSDSVTENLGASSDKWVDVEGVVNQLEVFRPAKSSPTRKR
jgi:PAS domain S-box-containing protein